MAAPKRKPTPPARRSTSTAVVPFWIRFRMYGWVLAAEIAWAYVYFQAPWQLPVAMWKIAMVLTAIVISHIFDLRAWRGKKKKQSPIVEAGSEVARAIALLALILGLTHGL